VSKTGLFTAAVLLLCTAACFPYREQYRPEIAGLVANGQGTVVYVKTCSSTKWTGLSRGCERSETVRVDESGRFHVRRHREWEWCCAGEAPMPFTLIMACGWDGRLAYKKVAGGGPAREVTLTLEPPSEAALASDPEYAFVHEQCKYAGR
jgi:hypothetical protein